MRSEEFEHAPLVEAWLKEPIWLPEIDTERTAQLVHLTPQQRGWLRPLRTRRSHSMFTGVKMVAAATVLAIFGGFLMTTMGLPPRDGNNPPAAVTTPPSPVADPSSAPEASPTGAPDSTPESVASDGALVMGAGSGQTVAGWSELGRLDTDNEDGSSYGEMRHLQAVGDRLVAIGSTHAADEGPTRDVIYHSLDGVTWLPAGVPGDAPRISHLAATADGVVAAGSDTIDGSRVARIWSSSDGIGWVDVEAPPELKRIDRIVSADAPLAVQSGRGVWANDDGTEWRLVDRLGTDMTLVKGPGGYLSWQFVDVATVLHRDDLTSGWTEVGLPAKLSRGGPAVVSDMQIFALDDLWVLVPHVTSSPDAIYISPDGIEWTEAPRPPGMVAGAVRWMADIDGQVQAFGAVDGDEGDEGGIWTFVPGEPVADAETMAGSDEFIDTPVEFGGGYLATGLKMGRDPKLTTWERTEETAT
jgi:hypothetical protein